MKQLAILFTLLFVGVSMNAQNIKVDKDAIDYGTIKKGANGQRTFVVKNTGNKPLIISKVQTSCGCTTPSYPKKPIMPGKTAEIVIKYDTQRVGPFQKSISVYSNALETPRKVLKITGTVEGALKVSDYVEKVGR